MKKTIAKKKVVLSKETIRSLGGKDLKAAAGGIQCPRTNLNSSCEPGCTGWTA